MSQIIKVLPIKKSYDVNFTSMWINSKYVQAHFKSANANRKFIVIMYYINSVSFKQNLRTDILMKMQGLQINQTHSQMPIQVGDE